MAEWTRYDDRHTGIIYNGSDWTFYTSTDTASFNAGTYSGLPANKTGDITFKFYGTQLRICAQRYKTRSQQISVVIDGIDCGFYSIHSGPYIFSVLYEKLGLELGLHTVVLTNQDISGDFLFDAIEIDSTGFLRDRLMAEDKCKTSLLSIDAPGDYVYCKYTATSNTFGTFSDLATKDDMAAITAGLIPAASSASPDGYFRFVHAGYDTYGRIKLLADRNIQHSVSWDTLNAAGVADGVEVDIGNGKKGIMRLLTGGVSATDKDNEWDKIIAEYDLKGLITAGSNDVWSWSAVSSWASTRSTGANVVVRGNTAATGWTLAASSALSGFRPELLVEESSNNITCFINPTHLYEKQHTNCIITAGSKNASNESLPYKILINSVMVSELSLDGVRTIPLNHFNIGANAVTIEDSTGYKRNINIVKEPLYRTAVERTFLKYDEGYEATNITLNDSVAKVDTSGGATSGIIETSETTNINLEKYSGVTGMNISATGGKYALSFDGKQTWNSFVINNYSTGDLLVPKMTSNSSGGFELSGTTPDQNGIWAVFDRTTAGTLYYTLPVNITLTSPTKEAIMEYSITTDSSTYPSAWELYGIDGDKEELLDTKTGQVFQNNIKRSFTIIPHKKYNKFKLNITDKVTDFGYISIQEIEFKKADVIDYIWDTITKGQISEKGMTSSDINSLTSATITPVFQRTHLDILGHLSGSEVLNSITVTLPLNLPPAIKNLTVTPDIMHKESVTMSCEVIDYEGDNITYEIQFNGEEYQAVTPLPQNGLLSIVFPDNIFLIGLNAIKIKVTDSRNVSAEENIYITRTNSIPKLTGILVGNIYTATIGDDENDKVQYMALFNGVEKLPWTELFNSPHSFSFEIDRREILYNVINTLRIEFKDELGEGSFAEEQFIGSYYGIMFTDENGLFYSTDLGDIIKELNFGTLIASQTSPSKEVKILNKYVYSLSNITINTPSEIDTKVYIEMSETYSPFVPTTSLSTGTLAKNESKSIYIRIRTEKASAIGGKFNINAEGYSME